MNIERIKALSHTQLVRAGSRCVHRQHMVNLRNIYAPRAKAAKLIILQKRIIETLRALDKEMKRRKR